MFAVYDVAIRSVTNIIPFSPHQDLQVTRVEKFSTKDGAVIVDIQRVHKSITPMYIYDRFREKKFLTND